MVTCYVNLCCSFLPGRRVGTESYRRGYRDLRGARLEPHEGSAGHGPRSPAGPAPRRQRVPAHHARHSRGENHGVSAAW